MENFILSLVILVAIAGIMMSVLLLLKNKPILRGKQISIRNFFVLLIVYMTVAMGFGCIYISLQLMGISVLTEGNYEVGGSFFHLLEDAMYFSVVTILSVGYGDITPLGIGRWVAMLEAFFGYLLPTAFVVSTVIQLKDRVKAN
ncbi:two pore domain potassium channel family protein [Anaerobacillus alkaliphilus]|uniref:Two pore domain potassium channel family protein n=1 Tax=Anaerobacillus alkaliphilus TaxID=1548597 RepID=A0A4Q0VSG5_9BACI|nr:potassium channel family protein [Anaerobacillus alkaliphilus]RXJ00421.1 two pore domain potassium channel family protein [Anaerobacillus alkaliphilus]